MAIKKVSFQPSTTAERRFMASLKKIAKVAGHIIETHVDGTIIINSHGMIDALERYAKLIEPWARRQSSKMLETVQNSNTRAYNNKAKAIGSELKKQFSDKELHGAMVRALQEEHVKLITSIPLEAGQRAQKLALEAALAGRRDVPDQTMIDQIQKELGVSTDVAVNRAKLIARTEVAKANAMINQVRAEAIGSTHYDWTTSHDGAVRDSHKKMHGKTFAWDSPPEVETGQYYHPGEIYNCRCYAASILPK